MATDASVLGGASNAVSHYATAPDLRMHYVAAGPDDGLPVILLHGFPEFWYTWRHQISALAAAGFRVIAPDQRGYNLTAKHGPYAVETLCADIAHLQDHLGLPSSHIVGHDWGGSVAWTFAALYPDRTRTITALNAPHLNAYQDALLHHPSQLLKSWYVLFFQLPVVPERLLRRDNYALVRRSLADSVAGAMTSADLDVYVEACAQPGALTAMLGWYRAIGRGLARHPVSPRYDVRVPSHVIWGDQDAYLSTFCNDTLDRYAPGVRIHHIAGASHWVQVNDPVKVNDLLIHTILS